MATFQDALSKLPIFEGVSDEARRRALLTAGLSMMQGSQLGAANPVAQIGSGISAGLSQLDKSVASEQAEQQRHTQNLLATRQAAAQEQQAEAQTMQADTAAQRADTEAAQQQEGARQFDAQKAVRDAKIDLDKAQAEWLRRRWSGDPSAATKVTDALIENKWIEARMENLYAAFPEKYSLSSGKPNVNLLMDQAFLDLHRAKGTAGSDTIGMVAENTIDASQTGANISAMQGVPPPPAAIPRLSTQAEVDALPPGSTFIWTDGKRYTKE